MSRTLKSVFVVAMLLTLTACAGRIPRQIVEVDPAARITRPAPGKSLVYFVRTSLYGAVAPSPLFDGGMYIGTIAMEFDAKRGVKKKNYIAYETDPGKHLFMTHSEIGDFLPAELLPGKTYYVQVRPVMGAWAARFYLTPQNGQLNKAGSGHVTTLPTSRNSAPSSGRSGAPVRLSHATSCAGKADAENRLVPAPTGEASRSGQVEIQLDCVQPAAGRPELLP